jgi:integrase
LVGYSQRLTRWPHNVRDRHEHGPDQVPELHHPKGLTPVLRRLTEATAPDELVFTAPGGGRLDQGNWYGARWQPAVEAARKAGLPSSPRFHDLRHAHAAWLISAGVPLPVIQKRLGHKSIKITVDVYGGLLVQAHEVADRALARALNGQRIKLGEPQGSGPATDVRRDGETGE